MSVFGNILSAIFSHKPATPDTSATSGAPTQTADATPAPSTTAPTASPGTAGAAAGQSVDVAAVLDDLASKTSETLNWKTSIVDLMKLLKLDSSLSARKELATELHFSGDTGDSAAMNVWLHKQVMQKLAENGGKVPADLQH